MAKYGYGYTKQKTCGIATEYAVRLGNRSVDKPLTLAWSEGFRNRWHDIRVQKPRAFDYGRANMAKEDKRFNYFSNLEKIPRKYNLFDKPNIIYNMHEKGISVDHKTPHIIYVAANPPVVISRKAKLLQC